MVLQKVVLFCVVLQNVVFVYDLCVNQCDVCFASMYLCGFAKTCVVLCCFIVFCVR